MVRGIVNVFYDLEKRNQKKKHITSLVNNDGEKITNPKDILEEEERPFKAIYTSRNMDSYCPTFNVFFETENVLSEVIIYMKKFHHADWLRACQLIPNSAES